jgi:activator of 2-hydroxyglutaryl-CoA dehydratase
MLDLPLDALGETSLMSSTPCSIDSTCAIFAETEVVTQRSKGVPVEDILAGAHKALSHRVAIMGSGVGFKDQVVFTGGVARNMGVKSALEREIGREIWVPPDPQLVGALGAALIALSRWGAKNA